MGIDPKLSKQIGENGFLNKDDQWNWFKQNTKNCCICSFSLWNLLDKP